MRKLTRTITASEEGRLIKYFVRSDMGISYSALSRLKQTGGMRVNGETVHANHVLKLGEVVELCLEEGDDVKSVVPEDLPVNIAYEDEDLLIVDKSAPLPCQCTPKQESGTLENRLAFYYRNVSPYVFRPLNRLDKGTSGLMAVAKNAHAFQLLQKQLHTDDFVREYLAVVEGRFEGEGKIDLPIAKEADATVRRVIDREHGKPAVTRYRVVESGEKRSLVRLRLETGRTHQIRVHMAAVAHPVTGDFLYGSEIDALPRRFALHACFIALTHPLSGARIELSSPLPDELEALLHE